MPPLSARQIQLLEVLRHSPEELSGQALHGLIRAGGGTMGLATVYRHLRALQQLGQVRCRHLPSGEALYAPRERDVHHLTCLDCGSSAVLHCCPLEQQALQLHHAKGFTPLFHTLEVFGLCAQCQAGEGKTPMANESSLRTAP